MTTGATPLTPAGLSEQLGAAYARFGEAERERHLELLARVSAPDAPALDAERLGEGRWRVTVCAADAVGVLSLIAGVLTAARLDIVAADLFTLRVPAATRTPRRRVPGATPARTTAPTVGRVLDVFEVQAREPWDAGRWQRLRDALASLLDMLSRGEADEARARVVDAVSEVLRSDTTEEARLWPISVETSSEDGRTLLRISGQDTVGFLFELANALALLGVNILGAEIRTVGTETQDTLAIGGVHGEPIEDEGRLRQIRAAVALIKQFTALLPLAPDPPQALRQFSALTRQLLAQPDWAARLPGLATDETQRTLAEVMGASEFLWEDFLRMQHTSLLPLLGDMAALDRRVDTEGLRAQLATAIAEARDFAGKRAALNAFKDREMFRIDLRHITGRIGFRGFAEELSDLAEVVVGAAAELAAQAAEERMGQPQLPGGGPCAWTVLALGKFGGRELGFASDVELLFVYEADGETTSGTRNGEYFDAFVRTFLDLIVARTEGIFEVDLRLRPHGNAGPLASSFEGLGAYYAPGGAAQQFERLALVKLRAVAGDAALGRRVEGLRDEYVYADAPLDRAGIAHLRERQMHELVPARAVSAKHSAGGLVDIEYWVQARQIEAGARDPSVRTPSTLTAIERLAAGRHIEQTLATELAEAYSFLRRLIDALRVVRGHARDLTIPAEASREFGYLARRLEITPAELRASIERHMTRASTLWETHPTVSER